MSSAWATRGGVKMRVRGGSGARDTLAALLFEFELYYFSKVKSW